MLEEQAKKDGEPSANSASERNGHDDSIIGTSPVMAMLNSMQDHAALPPAPGHRKQYSSRAELESNANRAFRDVQLVDTTDARREMEEARRIARRKKRPTKRQQKSERLDNGNPAMARGSSSAFPPLKIDAASQLGVVSLSRSMSSQIQSSSADEESQSQESISVSSSATHTKGNLRSLKHGITN